MNITNFFKRILILLLLSCFLLFIPGCDVFCIRRWFCIQLLFNVCVASIILFCTNLYSVCSFHTWCYHVPLVGSCRCDNLKLTCIQSRLRIMTRFHSPHMAISRFSVIFVDACTTLVVPLMCSFRILSLLVTPHIQHPHRIYF